jgi:hypothetical protein
VRLVSWYCREHAGFHDRPANKQTYDVATASCMHCLGPGSYLTEQGLFRSANGCHQHTR